MSKTAVAERATEKQDPPETPAEKVRPDWLSFGERFGLLILLLGTIVVFSLLQSDSFPTSQNAQTIVSSQSVIAVIAMGLLIPLVAGSFDISVGANAVLCSIALASLTFTHDWPLLPACVAVVVLGMLVGVFNGFLVAYGRLESLIATLGTSFVIGGLIQWYTNNITITGDGENALVALGTENFLGVPRIAIVAAIVAGIVAYVMSQTPFGRRITAIGSSSPSARLVGIQVDRSIFITFVAAGALGGIGGILMLAQQGSGNPANEGLILALPAIAAVFLGASAFTPGRFNVLGTIVGLLLVASFVSGLTLSGAQPWVQPVFNGASLIIAIGLSAAFRRRRLGAA